MLQFFDHYGKNALIWLNAAADRSVLSNIMDG
jgi:hypothetical protein